MTTDTLTMTTDTLTPTAVPPTGARRRRDAVRRLARAWRSVWEQAPPDDVERMARYAEALLQDDPDRGQDDAQAALVQALAGEPAPSRQQRIALEREAQERYFAHRHALLEGALTAAQVAARLRTTRQTPHDRARSGSLLAIEDKGVLRFPAWQFDADGPSGILAGLPDVLRALAVPPLAKASWLTRPQPALDGATPLQAVRDGAQDRVVALARGVGVN